MTKGFTGHSIVERIFGTLLCLALSGCGNFFPPLTSTNSMTFKTQTQVFLDSANTTTTFIPNLPRPYQPLYGFVSGSTSVGFGSAPGMPYAAFTDKTGTYQTTNNPPAGTWDVFYNWLPETQGCSSPNGLPQSQSTSGDWNVNSAPYERYVTENPNNPLTVTYTNNSYTAPTFYCNMVAEDLAGTDSPQVSNTAPASGATMTVTFNSAANPTSPLLGVQASQLSLQVFDYQGNLVSTPAATSSSGYSATFPFPTLSSGNPLSMGMYGTLVVEQPSATAPPGSGATDLGGEGYFFIGSANPNYTAPFGIAAGDSYLWNNMH